MGMPEISREREHVTADVVAGVGTGFESAGSKPVTKIVNTRSPRSVWQPGRPEQLPEHARDNARGKGALGQGHEYMVVIPGDTTAVLQIVFQGGTGRVMDRH